MIYPMEHFFIFLLCAARNLVSFLSPKVRWSVMWCVMCKSCDVSGDMSCGGWLMHHVHLLDDLVTDWVPSPDDSLLPRMPFLIADLLIDDDSFSCHVTVDSLMYKRLQLLPWVPILTSCGFGTQVSLDSSDVLDSIMLTCGFGTQTLSPLAWLVPPCCPASRPSSTYLFLQL
jgi:hypothetical protein